ncbi:MAG: hypothetical protein AB7D05_07050 [Mangrovibacterium sp.]
MKSFKKGNKDGTGIITFVEKKVAVACFSYTESMTGRQVLYGGCSLVFGKAHGMDGEY